MSLAFAKCTNCGLALQVESTTEAAICLGCGQPFAVMAAIQNYAAAQGTNGVAVAQVAPGYQPVDNGGKPPKKSRVWKIIAVILVLIILIVGGFFLYNALSNSDAIEGRYVSESGLYEVEFKDDFTCIWYQDVYGNEVYFDGTYEKDGDNYVLHMDGETYSFNTRFIAEPVEDGFIITGGVVYGELFEKK